MKKTITHVIKVLLVENHIMVRDSICSLLQENPQFDIVGKAENGYEGIQQAKLLKPDIVLMSVELPIINGIDATRKIIAKSRKCKVILLSAYPEENYVFEGIQAGASGYVIKGSEFRELFPAISAVVKGKNYLCSEASSTFMTGLKKFMHISKKRKTRSYKKGVQVNTNLQLHEVI
jgi:DNA-binding NarL/FixJ family response regulator